MAAIISGKVYQFPPNEINVKWLSLILADPQPHYEIETYAHDTTKPGPRFTGPIGLDGLYRKGALTYQGFNDRFEGLPRVNAVKGTWQGDHALAIERLVLGLGEPAERWTLTFFGEKLNVLGKLAEGREILVEGEMGE